MFHPSKRDLSNLSDYLLLISFLRSCSKTFSIARQPLHSFSVHNQRAVVHQAHARILFNDIIVSHVMKKLYYIMWCGGMAIQLPDSLTQPKAFSSLNQPKAQSLFLTHSAKKTFPPLLTHSLTQPRTLHSGTLVIRISQTKHSTYPCLSYILGEF